MTATIYNIYKNGVFLQNKQVRENCSIFVVPSASLVVTGAPTSAKSKVHDHHENNSNLMFSYSMRYRKNPWEGKYVTMTGGIYKGKRGIIKAVPNLEKCLVELLAENKIVTVRKSEVEESGDGSLLPEHSLKTPVIGAKTPKSSYTPRLTPSYGNPGEGASGSKTPMYGSKTPMYGSKTPMYGSKTPIYGNKTPMYGSKTPIYGNSTPNYGNRTPIYGNKTPVYGNKTPVYVNKTPSYGGKTPNYGSTTPNYGKKTPNIESNQGYGNKTPVYGNKTPVYGNKTPVYGNKTPIYGNKMPLYENKSPRREFETPSDRNTRSRKPSGYYESDSQTRNYELQGNGGMKRGEDYFKNDGDQGAARRSPRRFGENTRGNNKRFHRGSNNFGGRGNKRGRTDGMRGKFGGYRETRTRDDSFASGGHSRSEKFNSSGSPLQYYQAESIGTGSWYSPPKDPMPDDNRYKKPSGRRHDSPPAESHPDSFARPRQRESRGYDSRERHQERFEEKFRDRQAGRYQERSERPKKREGGFERLVKEEDPFWGT